MITYSQSFLQFLQKSKCKVARTLYRAYTQSFPAYQLMLTTDEVNYLTFREDGTISYLPSNKIQFCNKAGHWSREGRQNGKPAKVIRKLFTKNALRLFKDSDFECFCNSYKSVFLKDLQFQLLPNYAIPEVYDMEIADNVGSLFSSCMNGYSRYLNIYKNCECLSVLILKNREGLLCGRALVWKIDEVTLMDRIYVTHDFMYDCFVSYATEHSWWYKLHYKTYDHKETFVNNHDEIECKRFSIQTSTEFESYPYIDTFSHGDEFSLNNYQCGRYSYCNTDGSRYKR